MASPHFANTGRFVTSLSVAPVWHFVDTQDQLDAAVDALVGGIGPVAVDAERASGYRYGNRAYLIQFFRSGTDAFLVDPRQFASLGQIQTALGHEEWIFHAASQDLPCLADEGLIPSTVFDTELAARLLGMPRVGLGYVVHDLLGIELEKAHSAADWSTRPLPREWLDYAALDVTLLPELRTQLTELLAQTEKTEIARQEFDALLSWTPKPAHPEPWRRLSGLHHVTHPRNLAIARELWRAREELARERDIAPSRLLPDSSIVKVSLEPPRSASHLASIKAFHGRASRSELPRWWDAIYAGKTTEDLPTKRLVGSRELPPHRTWSLKFPEADARLKAARSAVSELSQVVNIPLENLLTPDTLRRLCWDPPAQITKSSIQAQLLSLGARPWQASLNGPVIADALKALDSGEGESDSDT